jgi:hypothetical protein
VGRRLEIFADAGDGFVFDVDVAVGAGAYVDDFGVTD